jgi:hypothetical protein
MNHVLRRQPLAAAIHGATSSACGSPGPAIHCRAFGAAADALKASAGTRPLTLSGNNYGKKST